MAAMDRNKVDQVMAISADRHMDQVEEYDDRLIPFAFGWQEVRNINEAAESFAERLDRFPAYDGAGEIERHYEEYAAILEEYSDRVLRGIDAAAEWHYREWAFDTFIDVGRGVLGRLQEENARDVAYRTAEDVFDIDVPEGEY